MARLPQPGGDKNTWGELLNDFLSVAHEPTTGALLTNSIGTAQLQSLAVTNAKLAADIDAGKVATGVFSVPRIPDLRSLYVAENSQVINAMRYGAKGDAMRIVNVTTTSGSSIVTAPSASFSAADIGKKAVVCNDFAKGTTTTIASVQSATQVTLANNTGLSLTSDGYFIYGTDDAAAIQSAINAAAASKGVDLGLGPNSPAGLGFTTVLLPTVPGVHGGYIISSQLDVPAGVMLDSQSFVFNFLTDRYAPCIIFESYSRAGVIRVDAVQGRGIQAGTATGTHADFQAGQVMIWHAGFSTEGTGQLRRQDALTLLGYGFLIDIVWTKGGVTSIYHDAGSDCSINRAHCIGARTGIQLKASNQVWYGTILLDTVGSTSGGTNGVNIDSQCSNVDINVQAFTIIGQTTPMDNVVAVGTQFSGLNRLINVRVQAALTSGNVLYLSNCQDVTYHVSASNNAAPSFGGGNINTAVVFGASISGYTSGDARMSSAITPYSGTVPGSLTYYRNNARYSVQAGTAPTVSALAANGTSAPAPTLSAGNDIRGRVSFGSGTSTSSGSQILVTFANSSAMVTTPIVTISAMSSATAALQPYVTSVSTTGFNVGFAVAPTASQSVGTYVISYRLES